MTLYQDMIYHIYVICHALRVPGMGAWQLIQNIRQLRSYTTENTMTVLRVSLYSSHACLDLPPVTLNRLHR